MVAAMRTVLYRDKGNALEGPAEVGRRLEYY